MASDCNPTIDSNDSSSYFQQTVCLQDWWLIKSKKDFQGKRLAVAGFSSKEQRAVRVFSSAPIIKRYDVFTLETADGITVIIKGFINKLRTNENGFPAEVFGHFLFGFPPHWEEYAEKWFEGDSTSGFVSRSNAGIVSISTHGLDKLMTDSGKTSNQHEKAINEARHENIEDVVEMNLGLKSSGNAKEQSKLYHDACKESSIKVLKECQQKNVADFVSCGQEELSFDIGSPVSSTTLNTMVERNSSQNVGHPSSLQNPYAASSSNVCGVGLEVTDRESSLMALVDGNPKLLQPSRSCTHDTLKHPTLMSGSEVNIATPCKIGMDRLSITPSNFGSRTCNSLKNLEGNQKDNLASKCYIKHKNNEWSSPFEACENQDEENLNRSSLTASARSGKKMDILEEIPNQLEGQVSKCQSDKSNNKWQEEQIAEIGLKTKRKRFISVPVGFDLVNNTVENISHEIGGEGISNLSDVGLQEHHNITAEKLDDECLKDGSQQNSKFPPAYTDAKCKQNHENVTIQAGIQSKKVRPSSRLGKANQKNDLKTAVGEKASSSGKKTKRKLDYNVQVTHPSVKQRTKGSIVSPELLSLKRSRSGRLLLPSLDFWRNQMAVYDADRKITGIQEGLHVVEPSRGSRSEPQRKRRPLK